MKAFIQHNKQLFLQYENEKWKRLAVLCCLTSHLAKFNVKLQSKAHTICDLITAGHTFQEKIIIKHLKKKTFLEIVCTHNYSISRQQRIFSCHVSQIEKKTGNFLASLLGKTNSFHLESIPHQECNSFQMKPGMSSNEKMFPFFFFFCNFLF